MSQKIFQLVDSLSEDELRKVKAIRAVGKQAQVLSFAIERYRSDPGKASEENFLPEISREHFYEICSVMLDRCYSALVPERGFALLEFLALKQLAVMFREELRKQEKTYIPTLSERERADHYYSAWVLASRFDAHLIDEKLLEHCREAFIAASENKQRAVLLVDIMEIPLRIKINVDDTTERRDVVKEFSEILLKLETEVGRIGNDQCRYHLSLAWAMYKFYQDQDRTMADLRLKQATEYLDALSQPVHRSERDLMRLRAIEMLAVHKDYDAAFLGFRRFYDLLPEQSPLWANSHYHVLMAECALMIDKFDETRQIIRKHAQFLFYVQPTHAAVRAALLLGLVDVFSGDLDAALVHSSLAHELDRGRNYTFTHDLYCRYLECTIHLLRSEYDLVRAVIIRSIQLLRTKGFSLKKFPAGYYYLVLEAFMFYSIHRKRVKDKRVHYYKYFTETEGGPFGKLLEFVHDKLHIHFAG